MHKAERALTMRTDLIRAYLANRFQNGHVLSFDERDTMELDFLRLTSDRFELRLSENEKPKPATEPIEAAKPVVSESILERYKAGKL